MDEQQRGWTDLAGHVAGRQVVSEANRRRRVDGVGADRSWRLGAEGESRVAECLAELVAPSPWERLRGRRPGWWVLHSVPVGVGSSDIDHVLGGPPGVFTINTKHHRTRRVSIEGDRVLLAGQPTSYVVKAVAEARRAARLLVEAMAGGGHELGRAGGHGGHRLVVRPVLAVVGARLLGVGRPGGVIVATPARLPLLLRELPPLLDVDEVAAVYEVARRSSTWTRR